MGKKQSLAGGRIDNILGENTTLTGHLRSDGNLRIDGVFIGTIETAGNVILGEEARVEADITAHSVQVWGAVKGNITADSRLEILSTGRVWGDILVASLLIDEGGIFRGQCLMGSNQAIPLIEAHREGEPATIDIEQGERSPVEEVPAEEAPSEEASPTDVQAPADEAPAPPKRTRRKRTKKEEPAEPEAENTKPD